MKARQELSEFIYLVPKLNFEIRVKSILKKRMIDKDWNLLNQLRSFNVKMII